MDTVRVEGKNTKFIAHRGLSGLEKENTLAAFIAAGNRGYYGAECDIHKTYDGRFVVLHDEDTCRVAGETLNVKQVAFPHIREFKLPDIDGNRRRGDLIVPSLEEYAATCNRYGMKSVVELKDEFDDGDLHSIIDIMKAEKQFDRTVFISFHFDTLVRLRAILPDAPIQFLTGEPVPDIIDLLKEHRFDLDICYPNLRQSDVELVHEAGLFINCWTVDKKEDAERLVDWGVDYITTNIVQPY